MPLDATLTPSLKKFGDLLTSPRIAREAAPVLRDLAEAIKPGADVVADLRKDSPTLERLFAKDLNREFLLLGELVAAAAEAKGGLVIEASRSEQARVALIAAAAKLDVWTRKRLWPVFKEHYKRIFDSTTSVLTKHDITPLDRNEIEEAILRAGGKHMGLMDIERDVKESLFKVIDLGRDQGLNPRETGRLIKEYVPRGRFIHAGSGYRARMIARTEVLHGQRLSSVLVYESSPVVKACVAFDGDHDDLCAGRNGQVFSFEESLVVIEETHPQCVLAFGPVT